VIFGFGPATRVYVATGVTDMRKGFWVCAKRLKKDRVHWPEAAGETSVAIRQEQLTMLLSSMTWSGSSRVGDGCDGRKVDKLSDKRLVISYRPEYRYTDSSEWH